MDSNYKKFKKGRVSERSQAGHMMFVGLMILISFAAGCAVAKPPASKVITGQMPVDNKKVISRLEGGQAGFVITEAPKFSTRWSTDFERSVALMQDDREEEAMPILEEIVRQSPSVTAPYINLAMIYRHADQFEQAEELLQEALELVPDHPVTNNEYGLLLRQTGRFEQAREVYEATLLMFPEYLPMHRNLGILCELYLGDTECAVEQYTIYSKAKPDDEAVALWIADLNLRRGSSN